MTPDHPDWPTTPPPRLIRVLGHATRRWSLSIAWYADGTQEVHYRAPEAEA